MAVKVSCADPVGLIEKIKIAIRDGTVQTWELDADEDLTHVPNQWKNRAWFHPTAEADQIVFFIFGVKSADMSSATYAVYHGRFIEMLLSHFDLEFTRAVATALPIKGDRTKKVE